MRTNCEFAVYLGLVEEQQEKCERERGSVSEKASVWDRNGREITSEVWIVRSRAIYLFSSCDTTQTHTDTHAQTHTQTHICTHSQTCFCHLLSDMVNIPLWFQCEFHILLRDRTIPFSLSLSLTFCLSPSLYLSLPWAICCFWVSFFCCFFLLLLSRLLLFLPAANSQSPCLFPSSCPCNRPCSRSII